MTRKKKENTTRLHTNDKDGDDEDDDMGKLS
jgi:hypothetical protein